MAILVAYDGSNAAQKAVNRAVKAADGEEIILLRVIEVADGMLEAGIDIVQERLKEVQDEKTNEVSEEIKPMLEAEGVEFRIETVVGKPSKKIVSFAEENDVSEIVVGSRGREGVSRVLLGNVAESVVRRAPVTVIVVR
ncbi:universal stress protein [Halalkalirubrum salinum]|uniref:universal stress protein n=1 Tax=Halalkalirubrum salinum TaxID=2563889 RepID=UPI0010FBB722|nr:universal stress protein [Halalkalirubrum salinum]